MLIGKTRSATTSICTADPQSITVRGKDLCSELIGHMSFTEYFLFLLTGKEPTQEQRFFLDVLLLSIAEHGLVPTNQAARMTLDADPGSLQGAVAAGILGCGSVILGSAEQCGAFLHDIRTRVDAGDEPLEAVVTELVRSIRDSGDKMPGFGHPLHKPVDPRTVRILALADEKGASGMHTRLAKATEQAVHRVWGKPLPMNVSMAIAAILLDLDFPVSMIKAIPILARTASLLAHLAEEQQQPIGFYMAHHAEEAVRYVGSPADE